MNRSEEVRDFYERMPYPAPLADLDAHRDLYKNPDRRRAEFHLMWPAKQPLEGLEILIAGCGTSQAARYALREPDARITAIDVSDMSLRYTRDLQRKYNLENLELRQLSIERVREIVRGTMVSHSFIAYRDDSADDSQPITFTGDSWRDYIPIRLPWTVCVRERLPPGSVAVLINQSHTFTDLILTVDSFEDRLLGAIDGNRTLGEIQQFALPDGDGEGQALRFFERLWQYDQVVFDTSRSAVNRE